MWLNTTHFCNKDDLIFKYIAIYNTIWVRVWYTKIQGCEASYFIIIRCSFISSMNTEIVGLKLISKFINEKTLLVSLFNK